MVGEDGKFEVDVPLELGINKITIGLVDACGNIGERELWVVRKEPIENDECLQLDETSGVGLTRNLHYAAIGVAVAITITIAVVVLYLKFKNKFVWSVRLGENVVGVNAVGRTGQDTDTGRNSL